MKSVTAIIVIALIFGTALLMTHWEKIEASENAFAKECNGRGGEARRWDGMLQCLGARQALKGQGK